MHFLADYFPLILFFVAFKLFGIYVATAVAIAASVIQIAYFRWRRGRVATIHWLSLAIIAVFAPQGLWPLIRNAYDKYLAPESAPPPLQAPPTAPHEGGLT